MVGAAETLLGTLTVVCPELVIRKGFNVKTDLSDKLMRISAKNFYNYLGHWLAPDLGLKEGSYTDPYQMETVTLDGRDAFQNWQNDFSTTKHQLKNFTGRGLGVGPFSYDSETNTYNDLTKALDKRVYSLPSPLNRNETDVKLVQLDIWPQTEYATDKYNDKSNIDQNKDTHYGRSDGNSYVYEWEGNWGDPDNQYQTEVTFNLIVTINNDRVPGSVTGDLKPTGAKVIVWCGDSNDYDTSSVSGSYYKTPSTWEVLTQNGGSDFSKSLKKFYNPFFSSGEISASNDGKVFWQKQITIKRPPFSNQIHFHTAVYTRGGYTFISIVPPKPGIVSIMNLGKISGPGITIDMNFGDRIWQIIEAPFIFLEGIINDLLGTGTLYNGRADVRLDSLSRRFATINKLEAQGYPAYMNFGNMSEVAYLFNQFEYPAFDRNPCFPYTNVMFMKKPYLLNKVVQNQYHYNSPYTDQIKSTRKYKYFVPNLFRLTFETNIGVYLEQLAKQHKKTEREYNFLTKTSNHTVLTEPKDKRDTSEMDEHLDQLLFPTNTDKWNTYIENGWADNKADTAFLTNFISSATESAPPGSESMPTEYVAVFSDYPALNVNSIAEIDAIIGTHADLKSKLEADDGRELNTWTKECSPLSSTYSGLSTSSPRNLSYKLIEYMIWYLDDRGKAFEIRNAVSNLIRYEQELDEILPSLSETGPDLSNYHVIGTELYDRECKE